MGEKITENSIVRLKREYAFEFPREKATVIGWLADVEGGVIVSPSLEGMRCWNVSHLEEIPERKKKEKPT